MSNPGKNNILEEFNDITKAFTTLTASPSTAKAAPRKTKAKRDADIRRQARFHLPSSFPTGSTTAPLSDITPGEAFRFDDDGDICIMTDEESFLILDGVGTSCPNKRCIADSVPVIRVEIHASYTDLPSAAEDA